MKKIKNYPVLGSFIADDFYFFFEEEGIKKLASIRKLRGAFVCHDNNPPGNLLAMKLLVFIFKPNKARLSNSIEIFFKKKVAHYYISEVDFNEALLNPTDWIKNNGPAWRDASSNVYISTALSNNAIARKAEILNQFYQAV